jgi:hypothetical protein
MYYSITYYVSFKSELGVSSAITGACTGTTRSIMGGNTVRSTCTVLPFEVLVLCKYVDIEFALCHYDPSLKRHAENDIS